MFGLAWEMLENDWELLESGGGGVLLKDTVESGGCSALQGLFMCCYVTRRRC